MVFVLHKDVLEIRAVLGVYVLHLTSRRSGVAKVLPLLSQEDVGHMSGRAGLLSTVSRSFFIKIQFYI